MGPIRQRVIKNGKYIKSTGEPEHPQPHRAHAEECEVFVCIITAWQAI